MRRGRTAELVYGYLQRHPSLRRGLEEGIISPTALAQWIGSAHLAPSSREALAVGIRRVEVTLREEHRTAAGRIPLRDARPRLYEGYTLTRIQDHPSTWSALDVCAPAVEAALESPRAFMAIQQGAPSLLILAPSDRLAPLLARIPPELHQGIWPGLTVAGIDLESVAPETPGVIAALDDTLARVNLIPRLMLGVGHEFRWVGSSESARQIEESIRQRMEAPGALSKAARRLPKNRGAVVEAQNDAGASAAEVARAYIDRHPSVADCLAYGIVNVTLLARRISEETRDPRIDALEMAIRRYPVLSDPSKTVEGRLLEVVAASRVEVRTRVALVSIPPSSELLRTILAREAMEARSQRRLFQILQGPSQVTILCESEYVPLLREHARSRREVAAIWDGLTALTVESPREVYETPGVVAYLAGTLSRQQINCVELMSLNTESTFVVHQADGPRAFQALSELVFDLKGSSPSREGVTPRRTARRLRGRP
jgi:hypothetical protein